MGNAYNRRIRKSYRIKFYRKIIFYLISGVESITNTIYYGLKKFCDRTIFLGVTQKRDVKLNLH